LHPDESFYTSGPFLLFLRHQPQHALALILRLVNFATERCVEVFFGGEEANVSIRTPFDGGERVWIGDWRVFYWFRYPMITAHIVGAALMALEKWFYESLDAGRSVENEIQTILTGTRSVAFAGVLFCVGKRNPELLTGPLRELICAREFHLWESVKQAEYSGINVGSFLDPGIMRKLKLEWEQMPHRRANLHELCCRLFLTKSESRPVFERIRTLWTSRSSEATTGPTRRFRGFGGLQNLNWRIGRK
jgi:hypothetical protein